MALSASFAVASSHQLSQSCYSGLKWKQKRLLFLKPQRSKFQFLWIVKSVLDNQKFSNISHNGAIEPDRILLELFTRTQKLEEQIGRDPHSPQAIEFGLNLGMLESDLYAALSALKKKEEDLQEAERRVLLEYNEKKHVKKNLHEREKELVAARVQQEKLEEELRLASMDLVSQATKIGDLKARLKESDLEISAAKSALAVKEMEIIQMKNELMKMSEEAADAESKLSSKGMLLDEANKIVEKQELELQELNMVIQNKERELEISRSMQKTEAEKFKVAEANLEKQTMDWLLAQQELKRLAEETSKQTIGALEEFGRVGKLLSVVRSELVLSQKVLASSRLKIDGHDQLLEKQLTELEEQRKNVTSYLVSLRDAQLELESERKKLRVANAQKNELEQNLSMERKLLGELQKELHKDSLSFQQAIQDQLALSEKLDHKSAEFEELQILLHAKESELAEARLDVQHLKSELASLQHVLEEKDSELSNANKMLEEVEQEISELKGVLFSREQELNQLMSMLNEKDERVQTMQHEVNNANLKFAEAETVVGRIVDLTEEMVLSVNNDGFYAPTSFDWTNENLKIKQLETELEFTGESLRAKALEVVAVHRALTIKDEELKMVLRKLDTREKEVTDLKGEMMRDKDEMKQLYALVQEIIGVNSLAVEKLQIEETAPLEPKAATSALQKIIEMSRELLNKACLSIEADFDSVLYEHNICASRMKMIKSNECSGEVKYEVSRLLTLTEGLVRDAGIGHTFL